MEGKAKWKVNGTDKLGETGFLSVTFFLYISTSSLAFSFQIIFNSIAYETGLKDRDYVVEINNTKVFEMSHDDCKDLIRKAGDHLQIKIER